MDTDAAEDEQPAVAEEDMKKVSSIASAGLGLGSWWPS